MFSPRCRFRPSRAVAPSSSASPLPLWSSSLRLWSSGGFLRSAFVFPLPVSWALAPRLLWLPFELGARLLGPAPLWWLGCFRCCPLLFCSLSPSCPGCGNVRRLSFLFLCRFFTLPPSFRPAANSCAPQVFHSSPSFAFAHPCPLLSCSLLPCLCLLALAVDSFASAPLSGGVFLLWFGFFRATCHLSFGGTVWLFRTAIPPRRPFLPAGPFFFVQLIQRLDRLMATAVASQGGIVE